MKAAQLEMESLLKITMQANASVKTNGSLTKHSDFVLGYALYFYMTACKTFLVFKN